ncbi:MULTISPECIES: hypothetical protein [unclassified Haloferax]|uniref:hypothetical protein n=1 Tax=unclassified Haloferax TaxID=2625095 RepID=UPI00287498BB|nr:MULTISPECIES: hypothetical protein [unclassified Haloferax]MDS0243722.1 hypothetical protein [Haloferax sp. S2CR25]MDS0446843.1 hypothetical protein [Haloferax sp. S2CR25-2]
MGYITGAFKYIVKSAFTNTYPMLVFGGATLAIVYLFNDLAHGRPLDGITAYATTKYLPPFTADGFITVLAVGCVWAGIKWYWNVPHR